MKDDRVIIPSALRLDVLDKIHNKSSRHPEMPRKGEKWCLVAESQKVDRRSCQRMPYLHQDEN